MRNITAKGGFLNSSRVLNDAIAIASTALHPLVSTAHLTPAQRATHALLSDTLIPSVTGAVTGSFCQRWWDARAIRAAHASRLNMAEWVVMRLMTVQEHYVPLVVCRPGRVLRYYEHWLSHMVETSDIGLSDAEAQTVLMRLKAKVREFHGDLKEGRDTKLGWQKETAEEVQRRVEDGRIVPDWDDEGVGQGWEEQVYDLESFRALGWPDEDIDGNNADGGGGSAAKGAKKRRAADDESGQDSSPPLKKTNVGQTSPAPRRVTLSPGESLPQDWREKEKSRRKPYQIGVSSSGTSAPSTRKVESPPTKDRLPQAVSHSSSPGQSRTIRSRTPAVAPGNARETLGSRLSSAILRRPGDSPPEPKTQASSQHARAVHRVDPFPFTIHKAGSSDVIYKLIEKGAAAPTSFRMQGFRHGYESTPPCAFDKEKDIVFFRRATGSTADQLRGRTWTPGDSIIFQDANAPVHVSVEPTISWDAARRVATALDGIRDDVRKGDSAWEGVVDDDFDMGAFIGYAQQSRRQSRVGLVDESHDAPSDPPQSGSKMDASTSTPGTKQPFTFVDLPSASKPSGVAATPRTRNRQSDHTSATGVKKSRVEATHEHTRKQRRAINLEAGNSPPSVLEGARKNPSSTRSKLREQPSSMSTMRPAATEGAPHTKKGSTTAIVPPKSKGVTTAHAPSSKDTSVAQETPAPKKKSKPPKGSVQPSRRSERVKAQTSKVAAPSTALTSVTPTPSRKGRTNAGKPAKTPSTTATKPAKVPTTTGTKPAKKGNPTSIGATWAQSSRLELSEVDEGADQLTELRHSTYTSLHNLQSGPAEREHADRQLEETHEILHLSSDRKRQERPITTEPKPQGQSPHPVSSQASNLSKSAQHGSPSLYTRKGNNAARGLHAPRTPQIARSAQHGRQPPATDLPVRAPRLRQPRSSIQGSFTRALGKLVGNESREPYARAQGDTDDDDDEEMEDVESDEDEQHED